MARGDPPSAPDSPFTRQEALGGLPVRRAQALLFLIESLTARAAARSRRAMELYPTEAEALEQELAFLESFSAGLQPTRRPRIQDIERHAGDWAPQIPADPRLRAATAHLLGVKYRFGYESVPGIRAALGLDQDAVKRAHQRLRGTPLEAIYEARTTFLDRGRWALGAVTRWVESLPPFWMAYSLTLTETVGAGILALPIAVALVGPLPAVMFMIVLGGASMLTLAYMAEAISRSGVMRSGNAFYGRLVADYLGGSGTVIATSALALFALLVLVVYYVGVSAVLSLATGVTPGVWPVLLAAVGLYLISRKTLSATVASALLVGIVNLILILAISGLALIHVRLDNLLYINVPFVGGRLFQPTVVALIIGAVLSAFLGHVSVCQVAGVVLRRDETGRSLIWGSVAAQATALILYVIWVLAVGGAVGAQVLAGQKGTSLEPLAAVAGPAVTVLGLVYAVLSMGLGSVYVSMALLNLVRERLPARRRSAVVLRRGRGRLVLAGRKSQSGLSYLGLESGQPRFRIEVQTSGRKEAFEMSVNRRWDAKEVAGRVPWIRQAGLRLTLDVEEARADSVRVLVTSAFPMSHELTWSAPGLRPSDLLDQPKTGAQLLRWLLRKREGSLAEAARVSGLDEADAHRVLDRLRDEGRVREVRVDGRLRYRPALGAARRRKLPDDVWRLLNRQTSIVRNSRPRLIQAVQARAVNLAASERGRFLLSISPVLAVLAAAEWLLASGRASFTGPIAWVGVIVGSVMAGLLPTLLVVSSRRKGEFVPGVMLRVLGHPAIAAVVATLFLANVFVHGLVIWSDPLERASGVVAGLLMVFAVAAMIRRGALSRRLAVRLWQDLHGSGHAILSVMASARLAAASVRLTYRDGRQRSERTPLQIEDLAGLEAAVVEVPATGAAQLKVSAGRTEVSGASQPLPAVLVVGQEESYDLALTSGQLTLPFAGVASSLELTFPEERV
jgi:tryptophan/tyrosine permease family protein